MTFTARFLLTFLLSMLAAGFVGCESTQSADAEPAQSGAMGDSESPDEAAFSDDEFDDLRLASDPLEPLNRAIFSFNDVAYSYVFDPLGKGYKAVTPKPFRSGVSNFFDNLQFPIRFVSSVLQGKPKRAGKETGKFLINSTVGVLGLFDVAEDIDGLKNTPEEDLGQTFGVWGIGNGPYLVLPILGPSTLRDTVGMVGDRYLHPINHADEWEHWEWEFEAAIRALEIVNELPEQNDRYQRIKKAAIDPYISVREAYLQFRNRELKR